MIPTIHTWQPALALFVTAFAQSPTLPHSTSMSTLCLSFLGKGSMPRSGEVISIKCSCAGSNPEGTAPWARRGTPSAGWCNQWGMRAGVLPGSRPKHRPLTSSGGRGACSNLMRNNYLSEPEINLIDIMGHTKILTVRRGGGGGGVNPPTGE